MNCLTSKGNWELRIYFTFDNGTKSFMYYNHFRVGPATDNYRLSISGFTGITPTNPFATGPLNGQQFSTYDRDNDQQLMVIVQSTVTAVQHQLVGGIDTASTSTSTTSMEDLVGLLNYLRSW